MRGIFLIKKYQTEHKNQAEFHQRKFHFSKVVIDNPYSPIDGIGVKIEKIDEREKI